MRTLAEERRQRTDQLLYSLPITTTQVVLGKYLALLVVYLIPLAVISLYPLLFSRFGEVYLPTSYGSLFAFFLMGAALLAVGVFLSSLTDNQGFAAGIGIAAILLNYYSVSLAEYTSSTAMGSLIALYVIALLLGVVIRGLTRNENLAYGVAFVLIAALSVAYFVNSSAFEGLLPDIMTKLSLFRQFNSFVNGAFDLTAIVLAILIAVNVFASALPKSMTNYDISSSKLYSITSNTKVVVNNLQQDVTIYWVVQSGEENDVIENLLSKYESLSDHIEVAKKNPDVYPTFTQQYTSESVPNNSLIVESGERSRYISYNDIYVQTTDMYSYSYSTSFDGEGAITSAIDYVVNEEQPKLYLVEGHGEADLPSTFAEQVEKDNIETESLSLLHTETIPEDADCLMIYAPESDLSEDEQNLLADYVAGGGKLLVVAGPTRENGILENLYSLLSDYGVEPAEGIVVESDSNYYSAFSGPAAILPELHSNDITDSLIDANYSVLMPIALGLTVEDPYSGAVTELLTTSGTSFSKAAGYAMSTYDYEDGDVDGPFATGVSVRPGDGEMVWFTSSYFLEDAYNASSSGANGDLVMNALADMIGESEAMAIRSKSLNYLRR